MVVVVVGVIVEAAVMAVAESNKTRVFAQDSTILSKASGNMCRFSSMVKYFFQPLNGIVCHNTHLDLKELLDLLSHLFQVVQDAPAKLLGGCRIAPQHPLV